MKKTLCIIFAFAFSYANAQWTQKTSLPAPARIGPASFVINSIAYVIGGRDANLNYLSDVWAYNDQTDTWTQKSNIPGGGKLVANGFQINGFGYICAGWTTGTIATSDLLKYDPTLNSWSTSTTFPGGARYSGAAFVVNNKAYYGLGYSPYYNDFWEFNPVTAAWTQKANFPFPGRTATVHFSINGNGYIGTGLNAAGAGNGYIGLSDFNKYDPIFNTWSVVSSMPGAPRHSAFSYVIGNNAYVGCGINGNGATGSVFNDFHIYNAVTDTWSSMVSLPGPARQAGTAFTIGNCGYIFGGLNQNPTNVFYNDLWQYCDVTGISDQSGQLYFNLNYSSETQTVHIEYSIQNKESMLISIYDISGKLLGQKPIKSNGGIRAKVDLQIGYLSKGIFLYRLTNENKNVIQAGKFSVM